MKGVFEAVKLTANGERLVEAVRAEFRAHLNQLDGLGVPTGRERSIMVTKLEEACMFAVRAIALGEYEKGNAE